MCNLDLINQSIVAAGWYTQQQIDAFVAAGTTAPVHTASYWASIGYHVKKGEHGLKSKLWVPKKGAGEKEGVENRGTFMLKTTYLFNFDQVALDD